MPLRLARALRAHLVSTTCKNTRRPRNAGQSAAELLEDRRLFSVNIVTPYSTAVEASKVGFVARLHG